MEKILPDYIREIRRIALSISIVLACFVSPWGSPVCLASAAGTPRNDPFQGDKAMREAWRKSQVLRQELSTDTTPERLTVGNLTYSVPRNYIYNRYLRILKVTYPGFEPFTDKTRDCFDRTAASKAECRTLELRLGAPYVGKSSYDNFYDGMNSYQIEHHQGEIIVHKGQYGYDVFSVGPDNSRTEYYAKRDSGVYFYCLTHIADDSKREGICTDGIALAGSHLSVGFFFQLKQIGDVPDIEAGIRKLMSTFPYERLR